MKIITLQFPQKTAKQTIDECNNTCSAGKILWDTNWYKNEDFYTKELPRKEQIIIDLKILHKDKSWNECSDIARQEKVQMLNFPEVVYLLKEYPEFREMLIGWNYTWTFSRSSGGSLVSVGDFDSSGARVNGDEAGHSRSDLGVCFSRSAESMQPESLKSVTAEAGQADASPMERVERLEERVAKLERLFNKDML